MELQVNKETQTETVGFIVRVRFKGVFELLKLDSVTIENFLDQGKANF